MPIIPSVQTGKDRNRIVQNQGRDQAVALKYSETEELPKVLAHGCGDLAKYIIDLAAKHGVPIHKDPTLAALLIDTDVGSSITPEAYRLLAEIISFLYEADCSMEKEQMQPDGFQSDL